MFEKELNQELKDLLRGRIGVARMDVETRYSTIRERQREGRQRLEREVRRELQRELGDAEPVQISVSHTSINEESWIIVVGSDQYVGVDLESKARKTQPGILNRITNSEERSRADWDSLKFWVVKEAAFKSNPDNSETVLPQYIIQEWNPSRNEGIVLLPKRHSRATETPGLGKVCRFRLLELEQWYIAFAHTF